MKRILWNLDHFLGIFGVWDFVMGMGYQPMGSPMFIPIL
jgi:hypothetical protein